MKVIKKNEVGYGVLIENFDVANYSETKKFLIESLDDSSDVNYFVENKHLYAVLQKFGIENENGRIYPEEILKREVTRYLDFIKLGSAIGETDHPESAIVSLANTSMLITEVWWEGATLLGKIKLPISKGFIKYGIVSAPADLIANHIINGVKVGVSSRGLGSVKESGGKKIVQDDYEIVGWDFVGYPSTRGSWTDFELKNLKQYVEQTPTSDEIKEQSYQKITKKNTWKDKIDNFLSKY